MAGKTAILAIRILADAKDAQKGFSEAESKTSKWSSGLTKASLVAGGALAAVGGIALSGAKAAAEDAQAQAILAQALHNTAGATDAQVAATEDWISKTALATGVADDQLRPALANLVRATGDVSASQKDMQLALDISAATGKDLESVTAALAKGYGGQTTALGKLVPGLDKAIVSSGDMNAITAELAKMTGGTMAASAETAQGQYARMTVAIDETKEGIGAALLPAIQSILGPMQKMAEWAAKNTTAVKILMVAIAAISGVILAARAATVVYNVVLGIQTGLQAKSAAAVRGNMLATTAYMVKTIAVKAATIAWTAVQWLLNAALTANPIGLVVAAIALLVAGIILAYKKSDKFREIVQAVGDVAKRVFDRIASDIGNVVDAIKSAVEWVQKLLDKIGKITGGVLSKLNPFKSAPAPATLAAYTSAAAPTGRATRATRGTRTGAPSSVTVNVTTTGLGASAPQIQDAVVGALRKWSSRNGGIVGIDGRAATVARHA